jgi:hypothetical protein
LVPLQGIAKAWTKGGFCPWRPRGVHFSPLMVVICLSPVWLDLSIWHLCDLTYLITQAIWVHKSHKCKTAKSE